MTAAARWAEALGRWAIPPRILDQAPANPWIHPPKMFRASDDDPADTASMLAAAAFLREGTGRGSVLDIGCGGGRSSLPLGNVLLSEAIGVDEQPAMLAQFAEAAAARGIPARTLHHHWPSESALTPTAEVVVCHHVAYNVAPIGEFVAALSAHARRGVVVELPATHPTSPFNPLWRHFWDLDRPDQPTADLFVEVVRETGWEPIVVTTQRAPRRAGNLDSGEFVAFVRQRLCLPSERDPDVAAALHLMHEFTPSEIVTVSWRTGNSPVPTGATR